MWRFTGGGGANKQHVTTKNTAKLDRETEELKHDKVPLDLGKMIQQGRQNKNMSQKDLATVITLQNYNSVVYHVQSSIVYLLLMRKYARNLQKVNEKAQVINDYEAGRGIPNQLVIGKIERVLGIKLRGKDRGKELPPPGTTTGKK